VQRVAKRTALRETANLRRHVPQESDLALVSVTDFALLSVVLCCVLFGAQLLASPQCS